MSLTLVTGVPGSSKTLYTVAVLLQDLLKSTVEVAGESKPVKLFTNIKHLLLEHEPINADNLNNWHEWAKAGDAICFDEVQEVWRPRAMGQKPSPAIEKLETHRHYGVDMILITQHPMLLDQNIRRLVGRHIHFRPFQFLFWKFAFGYEWDHASNPSSVKNAMSTFTFWHKKRYYALYKSAEAHTVQQRKMPFAIWILGAAVLALAVGSPVLYQRLKARYNGEQVVSVVTEKGDTHGLASKPAPPSPPVAPVDSPLPTPPPYEPVYPLTDLKKVPIEFKPLGCVAMKKRCECYGSSGDVIDVSSEQCFKASTQIAYITNGRQPSVVYSSALLAPPVSGDKSKPAPSEIQDSGFNLPVTEPVKRYSQHQSHPSGAITAKPVGSSSVMY